MIAKVSHCYDHAVDRRQHREPTLRNPTVVVSIGNSIRNLLAIWNLGLGPKHRVVARIDDEKDLCIAVDMNAFAHAAWAFWERARQNAGAATEFRIAASARWLDHGPFSDAVVVALTDGGCATRDDYARWRTRSIDTEVLAANQALFEHAHGYSRLISRPERGLSLRWYFPRVGSAP